ncbi:MAG TPA: hypothetical protein VN665_04315 [Candidatus Paceibacterota bacterium]|nr:hypothetical protein [Candidatus Paceibacterota bacterium]
MKRTLDSIQFLAFFVGLGIIALYFLLGSESATNAFMFDKLVYNYGCQFGLSVLLAGITLKWYRAIFSWTKFDVTEEEAHALCGLLGILLGGFLIGITIIYLVVEPQPKNVPFWWYFFLSAVVVGTFGEWATVTRFYAD